MNDIINVINGIRANPFIDYSMKKEIVSQLEQNEEFKRQSRIAIDRMKRKIKAIERRNEWLEKELGNKKKKVRRLGVGPLPGPSPPPLDPQTKIKSDLETIRRRRQRPADDVDVDVDVDGNVDSDDGDGDDNDFSFLKHKHDNGDDDVDVDGDDDDFSFIDDVDGGHRMGGGFRRGRSNAIDYKKKYLKYKKKTGETTIKLNININTY